MTSKSKLVLNTAGSDPFFGLPLPYCIVSPPIRELEQALFPSARRNPQQQQYAVWAKERNAEGKVLKAKNGTTWSAGDISAVSALRDISSRPGAKSVEPLPEPAVPAAAAVPAPTAAAPVQAAAAVQPARAPSSRIARAESMLQRGEEAGVSIVKDVVVKIPEHLAGRIDKFAFMRGLGLVTGGSEAGGSATAADGAGASGGGMKILNYNAHLTKPLEMLLATYEAGLTPADQFKKANMTRAVSFLKTIQTTVRHVGQITAWLEQAPRGLQRWSGMGKETLAKIHEILTTGHLRKLDWKLGSEYYAALEAFQKIWGIGPTKAKQLAGGGNGLRTIAQLRERVHGVPHPDQPGEWLTPPKPPLWQGKPILDEDAIHCLGIFEDLDTRIPRDEVQEIIDTVREAAYQMYGGEEAVLVECCGSYRRGKPDCGDVDIILTHQTQRGRPPFDLKPLLDHLHGTGFLTFDLRNGVAGSEAASDVTTGASGGGAGGSSASSSSNKQKYWTWGDRSRAAKVEADKRRAAAAKRRLQEQGIHVDSDDSDDGGGRVDEGAAAGGAGGNRSVPAPPARGPGARGSSSSTGAGGAQPKAAAASSASSAAAAAGAAAPSRSASASGYERDKSYLYLDQQNRRWLGKHVPSKARRTGPIDSYSTAADSDASGRDEDEDGDAHDGDVDDELDGEGVVGGGLADEAGGADDGDDATGVAGTAAASSSTPASPPPPRLPGKRVRGTIDADAVFEWLPSSHYDHHTYMGICRLPGEGRLFRRLDIKSYPREIFAFALLYFTGSDHFNRSMRNYVGNCGWCLSDQGLYEVQRSHNANGKFEISWRGPSIRCDSEVDIFNAIGIPYMRPRDRNCTVQEVDVTADLTTAAGGGADDSDSRDRGAAGDATGTGTGEAAAGGLSLNLAGIDILEAAGGDAEGAAERPPAAAEVHMRQAMAVE